MDGVTGTLPSGISVMQWKASLFPHEPDSAASHGWNWRRCFTKKVTNILLLSRQVSLVMHIWSVKHTHVFQHRHVLMQMVVR